MDINLVRLRLPLVKMAEQQLVAALLGRRTLFETPLSQLCSRSLSSDPELVRRHQKPGLPFVFSLPNAGLMDCLLMGPAIAELQLVLSTVAAIAQQPISGAVTALDYQQQAVQVAVDGAGELPVLSAMELLELSVARYAGCRRLRVELLTPLRLMRDGRELTRFEPVRFVCTTLRRISSLAAYYGTAADSERFVQLAAVAGSISLVRSLPGSALAGQRGVNGSFELTGPFDQLGPLLELGSLFNLGKGASFGMGAFRVIPLS